MVPKQHVTEHQFVGRIVNGEFVPSGPFVQTWMESLRELEGREMVLTFEPVQKMRSNAQLAFLFGVAYRYASRFSGYTPEELHEYMKRAFFPAKSIEIGGEVQLVTDGTTGKTAKVVSEFVDFVREFWLRQGVRIPAPNEREESE